MDSSTSSTMNSNLSSPFQTTLQPTRQATLIAAILAFVFIIFGLIGNVILITTILTVKKFRSNITNIFIVSLQFNDLLNIGFNQFFVGLSYANHNWIFGDHLCKLVVYFSTICMGCLIWHHCLIAIHRLIVVVYPQILRRLSVKSYVIVSLVITRVLPIVCCIPSFLGESIVYSNQALRCSINNKLQILLNILILIILPNVIIIICFLGIFFEVFRKTHANTRQRQNKNISTSHSLRREIAVTKMFAVLFTLFVLGYHPYGFVRAYDKDHQFHPDIFVLLTVLYCVSICASPLVYGIMNQQLRNECQRVLFNCWHCRRIDREIVAHRRSICQTKKTLNAVNGTSTSKRSSPLLDEENGEDSNKKFSDKSTTRTAEL